MLAQKNDTIKKSIVTLKELTADEKAQMQMEARERYRRDMASALDFGKEQGLEQSKQKISALENDLEESKSEIEKLNEHIRLLEEQLAETKKDI